MSALQKQVGGNHYKKYKIQPVEFIHANALGFIEGCAIKYIVRHRDKGGAEDIRKAIHFLEMLLELEYDARKTERSNGRAGARANFADCLDHMDAVCANSSPRRI